MTATTSSVLEALVADQLGDERAAELMACLAIDPNLLVDDDPVPRRVLAQALSIILFDDLMDRVPGAKAYCEENQAAQRPLVLDHVGAISPDRRGSGEIPNGRLAFTRILEPLGWAERESYALTGLRMTSRAYAHLDLPASIPQWYVSELHVDRFSAPFGAAADRVIGSEIDPLEPETREALREIAEAGVIDRATANDVLANAWDCFGCHHPGCTVTDYEALAAESSEMAWIATEGHVTTYFADRVPDLAATIASQQGTRAITETADVSDSGRTCQVSLVPETVPRSFTTTTGSTVTRHVPGSYFKFIQRGELKDGDLDLAFDCNGSIAVSQLS